MLQLAIFLVSFAVGAVLSILLEALLSSEKLSFVKKCKLRYWFHLKTYKYTAYKLYCIEISHTIKDKTESEQNNLAYNLVNYSPNVELCIYVYKAMKAANYTKNDPKFVKRVLGRNNYNLIKKEFETDTQPS